MFYSISVCVSTLISVLWCENCLRSALRSFNMDDCATTHILEPSSSTKFAPSYIVSPAAEILLLSQRWSHPPSVIQCDTLDMGKLTSTEKWRSSALSPLPSSCNSSTPSLDNESRGQADHGRIHLMNWTQSSPRNTKSLVVNGLLGPDIAHSGLYLVVVNDVVGIHAGNQRPPLLTVTASHPKGLSLVHDASRGRRSMMQQRFVALGLTPVRQAAR